MQNENVNGFAHFSHSENFKSGPALQKMGQVNQASIPDGCMRVWSPGILHF